MKYRGLIHFHSNYSYDSILSIRNIIQFALKENINFLVLTDHNSIKNSLALKKYIKDKKFDIEVIIAAEYATEFGDVIALGIDTEITNMTLDAFIDDVKNQNGLLLFPHPYKGHEKIELIAEKVDFIEVFNSRIDDESNKKALNLAKELNKPVYYASDSHNYLSLKNCIIEFNKNGSFLESLKKGNIVPISLIKSYYFEITLSQLIKAFKNNDLRLFVSLAKNTLTQILSLKIFGKI